MKEKVGRLPEKALEVYGIKGDKTLKKLYGEKMRNISGDSRKMNK